jgi:hypothetical protein
VTNFKRTLACGVALAGLAIALPAHATLMLTVTDPKVTGTNPCSNNNADNGPEHSI